MQQQQDLNCFKHKITPLQLCPVLVGYQIPVALLEMDPVKKNLASGSITNIRTLSGSIVQVLKQALFEISI